MWKEWTKKIKTFAEDITSPDYDEEKHESQANEYDDDGDDNAASGMRAARSHAGEDEVDPRHGPQGRGDGSSLLLETPARRLEKNYDEPTVERHGGTAPPTATPASSAVAKEQEPSISVDAHVEESEEAVRSSSSASAHAASVDRGTSAELPAMTAVHVAPRRGPPLARATPLLQQQQQQPQPQIPPQPLATTATAAASASKPVPVAAAAPAAASSSLPSSSASRAVGPKASTMTHAQTVESVTASSLAAPPPTDTPAHEARRDGVADKMNLSTSSTVAQQSQQQQRIAELESENTQLLTDVRNYQEEVRVAHEQTVAYYEAKLAAAERNADASSATQQLESFRVALRTAAEELEQEQTSKLALEKQVATLTQEADTLRSKMMSLEATLKTAASTHTDAEWTEKVREGAALQAKLTQQTAEQEAALAQLRAEAEADRQSLEEQLHITEAQLTKLQVSAANTEENTEAKALLGAQATKTAAVQAELSTWKLKAVKAEEALTAAQRQNDTITQQLADEQAKNRTASQTASSPSQQEELAALKQQLASAEAARRALETQLQEAQTELMASFTANRQQRAVATTTQQEQQEQQNAQHAEELETLNLQLQSAQQKAVELTQRLAAEEREKEALTAQLAAEQAKGLAAHDSVAASSRASAKEVQRLSAELQEAVAQANALKAEVQQGKQTIEQLTNRLNADAQTYKKTIHDLEEERADAEAALEEELAEAKAASAESEKFEEQLRTVRVELQQTQSRLAQAEADGKAAGKARDAAEAKATAAARQCTALEKEYAALQQQLQRAKDDLAQQQQELKRLTEKEMNSGASLSMAALTNVKRELEDKVQMLEVTLEQVRRLTVDTLVRLGVDVAQAVQQQQRGGGGGGGGTPRPSPKDGNVDNDGHTTHSRSNSGNSTNSNSHRSDGNNSSSNSVQDTLPVLQLFSLLTTECVQQHNLVLRAERVQQEWEQTYEQARQVNESLNHQVAEAWATIGKLREDASVKEAAARQMQSRVGSGDARLIEVQEELTRVTAEAQQLREDRDSLATRLQQAETAAATQDETLTTLQEELQGLQSAVQEKDDELQSSQQSLANLQMVLDRFQETKQHEVEALTLESHMEAESLKKEVEECHRVMEQHEQAKAALRESCERQLAAKDAEVTTLHLKLAEVRKVLERTTSRHMDGSETNVDKRIVSQLLAKYINAFIGQRKEAEDMLKVLSGLLDWDEATQEIAGLLPGPNNPHPPGSGQVGQRGGRTGLFGWRRAKGSAAAATTPSSSSSSSPSGAAGGANNKAGLASMWVEFLLKESEGKANAESGTESAVLATPSTPTGASVSGVAASKEASAAASPAAPTTTPAGATS